MRLTGVAFILTTSTLISVNVSASKAARAVPFCGLIKNKIYCYGGSTTRSQINTDGLMFTLDISDAKGTSMSEFENKWIAGTPNTAGVDTHLRRDCQYAVVGSQLVISGGTSMPETGPALIDQTIAYNADDNTWKSYPNYVEGNFGNRQIFYASTAVVPSKGLAFYGGYERPYNTEWNIVTDHNLTATVRDNFRAIGYTNVVYLDITNINSPWSIPPQTNAPTAFSAYQTSVYDPISMKIFFFGGTYEDTLNPAYGLAKLKTLHKLSYALMFDTSNGAWGNQTLTGNVIPTDRKYHTTTLLPKGQSTVLLYGGEKASSASMDICFILDLKSFAWAQVNINASAVDLRRTRHSAVLANNETLFIVMGFNGVDEVTSLPIVLNIADPSAISYVEKYTDPNPPQVSSSDNTTPNTQGGSSGNAHGDSVDNGAPSEVISSNLSIGALVGIAVGAGVGSVIGFATIFFCWRKKKAQKKNKTQSVLQFNTAENHSTEGIKIDWDEVDRHYTEMPTHKTESDTTSRTANAEGHNAEPISFTIPDFAVPIPPDSLNRARQPYITKPDGGNSS